MVSISVMNGATSEFLHSVRKESMIDATIEVNVFLSTRITELPKKISVHYMMVNPGFPYMTASFLQSYEVVDGTLKLIKE